MRASGAGTRRSLGNKPKPYVSKQLCPETGSHILTFEHASGVQPWETSLAEHRFFPDLMRELEEHLDESIGKRQASCIIITNDGKYWSNGYDLKWMGAHPDEVASCLEQSERLLAKVLVSPVPIVAALGGHATALGMMMALACDYRIMGTRGLFSTPAVELDLLLSEGLHALVRCKLPPHLQRDILVLGRKLRSEELLRGDLSSLRPETREHADLLKASLEFVQAEVLPLKALTKPEKFSATKRRLYEDAYRKLDAATGSSDVMQYQNLGSLQLQE